MGTTGEAAERMGWTEEEVRGAVAAYFSLLDAQLHGDDPNKAAIYRSLAERFPQRGPGAFEVKFQNISAILYEQRLPYCKGLKPRHNYQMLLKLFVLDRLDRSPLPAVEPHQILFSKLRELRAKGPVRVSGSGSGRYGLALEDALGIPPNSSKTPDFMGIELKTKGSSGLQTLFSRTPSHYLVGEKKAGFFKLYSHYDPKRDRRALYTSFSSKPDRFGFSLETGEGAVRVLRRGDPVLEYEAERLEEALLRKLSQTAYVTVSPLRLNGAEFCTLDAATYCKWASIIRFLRLVSEGGVFLDFTMSEKTAGNVTDHGFLWRVRGEFVSRIYLHTEAQNLG